jgi:hypothetical protein
MRHRFGGDAGKRKLFSAARQSGTNPDPAHGDFLPVFYLLGTRHVQGKQKEKRKENDSEYSMMIAFHDWFLYVKRTRLSGKYLMTARGSRIVIRKNMEKEYRKGVKRKPKKSNTAQRATQNYRRDFKPPIRSAGRMNPSG